jgi:murein DD-endopeptidase MepM/ murein hydrolase activator NlpD
MSQVPSLLGWGLAIALPIAASAQPAPTHAGSSLTPPANHQAQIEARTPFAPRIVTGSDGHRHLAYELRVTSFQSDNNPLKLTRLAIFSGTSQVPMATIEGAALQELLNRAQANGKTDDGVPIGSGLTVPLFLWLPLPAGVRPDSLRHQLTFLTAKGEIEQADNVRATIDKEAPLRIAPPLRGGRWLAVEGPGNPHSHHWGSPVAIDGKLTIPQRFAIDWFGLDEGNHSLRHHYEALTSSIDEDWVGYGKDVVAVADGVVADAHDGIANGKPLRPLETPEDLTARTLYGNFVVLAIAPGAYAHYAHLQQGSVTVRPGQHVARGQVLGRVGQTGSAGAPHLHFHVSDRPSFEGSEGLPFLIDGFTLYGTEKIEESFDPEIPHPLPWKPILRKEELPLDGDLVGFP